MNLSIQGIIQIKTEKNMSSIRNEIHSLIITDTAHFILTNQLLIV